MTQKTFYLILALLITSITFGQKKEPKEKSAFWKKVHFGGGIQLNLSAAQTTLGLSPSVIYSFSDKFAMGGSGTYLYSSLKYSDVNYHVFGLSTLTLYNPHKRIQISAEFEELNINIKSNSISDSYWQPALYFGLGYHVGRHSAVGFRYDVLFDKEKSIYDSALMPFFRIYF